MIFSLFWTALIDDIKEYLIEKHNLSPESALKTYSTLPKETRDYIIEQIAQERGTPDILDIFKPYDPSQRPEKGSSLLGSALTYGLSSCLLRCYLFDVTEEDLKEMIGALEKSIPVEDTQVYKDWIDGLPFDSARKFLAINTVAHSWTTRKPQGEGLINKNIARILNKNQVLKPLRRAIAKQSLKLVGKGGIKFWGRVGSKVLPIVGWVSVGYEFGKACNCAYACADELFYEKEKIWGQ